MGSPDAYHMSADSGAANNTFFAGLRPMPHGVSTLIAFYSDVGDCRRLHKGGLRDDDRRDDVADLTEP